LTTQKNAGAAQHTKSTKKLTQIKLLTSERMSPQHSSSSLQKKLVLQHHSKTS
jgi:hypothetical protein